LKHNTLPEIEEIRSDNVNLGSFLYKHIRVSSQKLCQRQYEFH